VDSDPGSFSRDIHDEKIQIRDYLKEYCILVPVLKMFFFSHCFRTMARQQRGLSRGQIRYALDNLPDLPDEDDDDLQEIEIEPEDDDDDGITETEEVIYADPVTYRHVSSFFQ